MDETTKRREDEEARTAEAEFAAIAAEIRKTASDIEENADWENDIITVDHTLVEAFNHFADRIEAAIGRISSHGGGFDRDFNDVLKRLKTVEWRRTMFSDLRSYYAEEGTYVFRCKPGEKGEHLVVLKASSYDQAMARFLDSKE